MLKYLMSFAGKLKTLDRPVFHLLLIALLGLVAYSNTFDVPFHFDDTRNIVENPIIKDLGYFFDPTKAEGLPSEQDFKSRFIGYLTFALNYKLHGLDVTGYHVVNIAIHILNAMLVYLLVALTFRTPFLSPTPLPRGEGAIASGDSPGQREGLIALFSSLLFVSHPIQTQAVTYIVQRFASLATFFYLFSLALYIKWRLSFFRHSREGGNPEAEDLIPHQVRNDRVRKLFLYFLSLLSVVLAMKTKEIACTLPLVITIYEFMFFEGPKKRRLLYLVPFLLALLIIPLTFLDIDRPVGELIGDVSEASKVQTEMPRLSYLFTQSRVIATYMRLLIFPVNQNLDYDYPAFHSLFEWQVFLSAILHLSVLGLAIYFIYRSRKTAGVRLASFGILWFYLALLPESSLVPIVDVIYEHRAYLPSVGIFIAAITGMFLLGERLRYFKATSILALSLLIFVFVAATYTRNTVWASRINLWEDVVKKSPNKIRSNYNLGCEYSREQQFDKAIEHYRIVIMLAPDHAEAHNGLGLAYGSKGLPTKAVEHFQAALMLSPDNADIYRNLGAVYGEIGLHDKAIEYSTEAVRLRPDFAEAFYNLGVAYEANGLAADAIEGYKAALRLRPDYVDANYNIAVIYQRQQIFEMAIPHYEKVIALAPEHFKARYNLTLLYKAIGSRNKTHERLRGR